MVDTDTITAEMIEAATEGYRSFEVATREPEGDKFVRLNIETQARETWVYEAVKNAHGKDADGSPTMLPDDHRYRFIRDAFGAISEAAEGDDAQEVKDSYSEPDIYTSDLLAWLASHTARVAYCDEAMTEFGGPSENGGILGSISLGQSAEKEEVFDLVLQSIAEHLGESEAES